MIYLVRVVYVLCNNTKRISWVSTMVKAGHNVCKIERMAWKRAYMQLILHFFEKSNISNWLEI